MWRVGPGSRACSALSLWGLGVAVVEGLQQGGGGAAFDDLARQAGQGLEGGLQWGVEWRQEGGMGAVHRDDSLAGAPALTALLWECFCALCTPRYPTPSMPLSSQRPL